jgi:hypothetical protein
VAYKHGASGSQDLLIRGMAGAADWHEVAVTLETVNRLAADDRALIEALHREGAGWAEERVRRLGLLAGSEEAQRWADEADRFEPVLRTYDRYGNRVDEVEATRRRLTVDVLSPRNEPSGATARVVLRMDLSGEVERTARIRGRLFLTPTPRGWRVFGYDVQRDRVGGNG